MARQTSMKPDSGHKGIDTAMYLPATGVQGTQECHEKQNPSARRGKTSLQLPWGTTAAMSRHRYLVYQCGAIFFCF